MKLARRTLYVRFGIHKAVTVEGLHLIIRRKTGIAEE
jgi:hypothetical protein